MDRTMSDAEDTVRYWLGEEFGGPVTRSERDQFNAAVRGVLAELDAERAAHEATRIGSYSAETMANMVEERDRLEARLALAEKWAAFGSDCFDAFWCDGEPGDLDAGDMQERALSHGLLRHRTEGDNTLNPDADNCCEHCPCVTEDAPPSECECLFPTLAAWRAAK